MYISGTCHSGPPLIFYPRDFILIFIHAAQIAVSQCILCLPPPKMELLPTPMLVTKCCGWLPLINPTVSSSGRPALWHVETTVSPSLWNTEIKWASFLGLDTLCFYFCLLFYSLMLSSHAYYMLLKLTYSSQIMLKKFFGTQTKYLIFYCTAYHTSLDAPRNIWPYACGSPRIINREKGLRLAYYSHWSKPYASQCLLFPKLC